MSRRWGGAVLLLPRIRHGQGDWRGLYFYFLKKYLMCTGTVTGCALALIFPFSFFLLLCALALMLLDCVRGGQGLQYQHSHHIFFSIFSFTMCIRCGQGLQYQHSDRARGVWRRRVRNGYAAPGERERGRAREGVCVYVCVSVWVCVGVGVRVCGCVGVWVCGCVGVWVCWSVSE